MLNKHPVAIATESPDPRSPKRVDHPLSRPFHRRYTGASAEEQDTSCRRGGRWRIGSNFRCNASVSSTVHNPEVMLKGAPPPSLKNHCRCRGGRLEKVVCTISRGNGSRVIKGPSCVPPNRGQRDSPPRVTTGRRVSKTLALSRLKNTSSSSPLSPS